MLCQGITDKQAGTADLSSSLYSSLEQLLQHPRPQTMPRGTPNQHSFNRFQKTAQMIHMPLPQHHSHAEPPPTNRQWAMPLRHHSQTLDHIASIHPPSTPPSHHDAKGPSTTKNSIPSAAIVPSCRPPSPMEIQSPPFMSVDPDDSGSEAGGNDVSPASSPPHGTKQKLPTTAIWPHPSIPDPSPAFLQIGSLPRLPIWHPAPFPQEYAHLETLFLCDLCLKYMPSSFVASRHKLHCVAKHPPGSEIYRDGPISIFEVDGRKSKAYCQNLCLLAKSYLNHKTLYYDVEPFLFYVLTLADSTGCHFAGYFSKEKTSEEAYNLSCIMTLPLYQSQGFGQLLIDLSYQLSSKENKLGSPEKPLSSLGLKCYDKYWAAVVFACLADAHAGQQPLSVQDICYKTRMTKDDVLYTLAQNQWLAHTDPAEPYHFVLRSPFPANTNHRRIKRNQLHWVPF